MPRDDDLCDRRSKFVVIIRGFPASHEAEVVHHVRRMSVVPEGLAILKQEFGHSLNRRRRCRGLVVDNLSKDWSLRMCRWL